MKFASSQLAYLMRDPAARANLRGLLKYLATLALLITVYAVLFHVIKIRVEGEQHSWISGFYWTLVVMTTLGFGDITFTSDIGRVFSVVVLLSGVFLLLVMLPFLFISLFYAPWLEARVRLRAPREVPDRTTGHVILTELDAIAAGLVERLAGEGIPYFVIEPDPAAAARLVGEGISVVTGDNDSRGTYERLRAPHARLLLANCEDTTNTNITITAREIAPDLPIVALVEEEDSIDVLQLSGATTVLPLKQQLGESLANRVAAGGSEAHVIGSYRGLQIAELPARDTVLAGRSVRDTRLRERTGLSVVGLWERGRLKPAFPDSLIGPDSVVVLTGSAANVAALNALMPRPAGGDVPPVLVIGAGKVGQAAARALHRKGLPVHGVDRTAAALEGMRAFCARTFPGDAADRRVLDRAGIGRASSVLLTTNDDAMNIYLAVYCRKLQPNLRIVSRITHERNVEAIHRAGADFVLSYTTLGIEAVLSLLRGYELVVLGEGVELFSIRVPRSLAGKRLAESGIGSRTGMSVVALENGSDLVTTLTGDLRLPPGSTLLMLGSAEQRRLFAEQFEQNG
ncbi:MAG TPA: NAD-binding protein [Vicinamibacterales bacterium]|nr:NAD-binding protein [Vicinamibacterales bacterium]